MYWIWNFLFNRVRLWDMDRYFDILFDMHWDVFNDFVWLRHWNFHGVWYVFFYGIWNMFLNGIRYRDTFNKCHCFLDVCMSSN